jgi:hypothetical protein
MTTVDVRFTQVRYPPKHKTGAYAPTVTVREVVTITFDWFPVPLRSWRAPRLGRLGRGGWSYSPLSKKLEINEQNPYSGDNFRVLLIMLNIDWTVETLHFPLKSGMKGKADVEVLGLFASGIKADWEVL